VTVRALEGFLSGELREPVVIAPDEPDLERRLEALAVLARTDSTTSLADLFEATSEL
jgi:hypothetical protein